MANLKSIDAAFTQAVETKAMPGIVAMAANDKGVIYEGAFGKRDLSTNTPMTRDSVVWIASMTKAITAAAAMQLVEQGKLSLEQPASATVPELALGAGARGLRRRRQAAPPPAQAADHLAPPPDPHGRLQLRDLAPGDRQVPDRDRHAGHHDLHERRAHHAASVRPGRPLGLRHQHRLGGQDGRGGERARISTATSRTISSARSACTTRRSRSPRPSGARLGAHPPAGRQGRAHPRRPRAPPGAGVPHGRGRPLRHGRRLPELHANDPAGRHAQRERRCCGARRSTSWPRTTSAPLEIGRLKTAIPSLSNDVELFPGMSKKWGLSFLINTQDAAGRPLGGQPGLGGAREHVLLDRSHPEVSGVFLSQVLPFYDETAIGLFGKFETEVYKAI